MQKALERERARQEIIGVESSDRTRLLKAISEDAVDFILPDLFRAKIDSSIATLAKRANCAVALSLQPLLYSRDAHSAIRKTVENLETLEHYNTPVIFASFARDEFGTRSGPDMENLLEILLSERPKEHLARAGRIILRNSERKKEIIAGVRILEEGKDE